MYTHTYKGDKDVVTVPTAQPRVVERSQSRFCPVLNQSRDVASWRDARERSVTLEGSVTLESAAWVDTVNLKLTVKGNHQRHQQANIHSSPAARGKTESA